MSFATRIGILFPFSFDNRELSYFGCYLANYWLDEPFFAARFVEYRNKEYKYGEIILTQSICLLNYNFFYFSHHFSIVYQCYQFLTSIRLKTIEVSMPMCWLLIEVNLNLPVSSVWGISKVLAQVNTRISIKLPFLLLLLLFLLFSYPKLNE